MDLAIRDIAHHKGKFIATVIGVGLLFAVVLSMNGIYRGFIFEGLSVIQVTSPDLWVVERYRGGPFNEQSSIPEFFHYSIEALDGVEKASPFIFYNVERIINGNRKRFTIIGYDIFKGLGGPQNLTAGRQIEQAHYEMVAHEKIGFKLGDKIPLGLHIILEPTAGTIVFDDNTIYSNGWTDTDLRRLRREKVGFVFQTPNLIPFLTARENILFPLELVGVTGRKAQDRATELLEYMEVAHRSNYLPAFLSGGEQQRVSVARALANRPKLILADEPTAVLDTARGKKVMEFLKKLAREHQTAVITVTHDVRMIEGFDHVYHLKDGQLNSSGEINKPDIPNFK